MTDRVAAAMDAIDYDFYVVEPDGSDVPQSSNERVIARMAGMLDVRPGQRVLEIGTGSGYTAALLAMFVSPGGAVTSLDVDQRLVARARAKHRDAEIPAVDVHVGDGYLGWPDNAPYDRIIGWACPHVIPAAWLEQATSDAVIVTPVKVAPLAAATAIATIAMREAQPSSVEVSPGGFIEMHPEPITEFGLPIRYVDAAYTPPDGEPWWISAEWLRTAPEHARDLLGTLRAGAGEDRTLLDGREELGAFSAWLYATRPSGLATAGIVDGHIGVGATTDSGAAFLTNDALVTAGTGDARELLVKWLGRWRDDGRPGWVRLSASAHPDPDGWQVRLTSPTETR